jgi:DNA-binding SARP family transcriptional activator
MTQNLVRYLLSHSSVGDVPAVLLFGGPCVTVGGRRLEVPEGSKRLLVFIALADAKVDRRYAAGALWPDSSDDRAAGNLRSALWRLRGAGIDLIGSDKQFLLLRPDTLVDVKVVSDWADRLAQGMATSTDLHTVTWRTVAMDLLPGWYDDWVVFERERIRQRLLHALEAMSRDLIVTGRWAEAVEAAIVAVSADPLRETANRILIEAHLAEGNFVEARRAYARYSDLVGRELGVEPSRELAGLVQNRCGQLAAPGSRGRPLS